MGELNVDLDEDQNPHIQIFANTLMEFGLINLMHHFRKRKHLLHVKTWGQVWQGTVLRVRFEYTLGTDRRLFNIVGIKDMMNSSSYPFNLR